jgi:hypothetical protein
MSPAAHLAEENYSANFTPEQQRVLQHLLTLLPTGQEHEEQLLFR